MVRLDHKRLYYSKMHLLLRSDFTRKKKILIRISIPVDIRAIPNSSRETLESLDNKETLNFPNTWKKESLYLGNSRRLKIIWALFYN